MRVNDKPSDHLKSACDELEAKVPLIKSSGHLERPGFDFRTPTPADFVGGLYVAVEDSTRAKVVASREMCPSIRAALVEAGYNDARVEPTNESFDSVFFTFPEAVSH